MRFLLFRAWDNSSSKNFCDSLDQDGNLLDTSSFSDETNSTVISVTYLNRAPILSTSIPVVRNISEDISLDNIGYTSIEILANISIDLDDEELGIAIIELDNILGKWEYASDTHPLVWLPISTNISEDNPLLLNPSSRIRLFLNYNVFSSLILSVKEVKLEE